MISQLYSGKTLKLKKNFLKREQASQEVGGGGDHQFAQTCPSWEGQSPLRFSSPRGPCFSRSALKFRVASAHPHAQLEFAKDNRPFFSVLMCYTGSRRCLRSNQYSRRVSVFEHVSGLIARVCFISPAELLTRP